MHEETQTFYLVAPICVYIKITKVKLKSDERERFHPFHSINVYYIALQFFPFSCIPKGENDTVKREGFRCYSYIFFLYSSRFI